MVKFEFDKRPSDLEESSTKELSVTDTQSRRTHPDNKTEKVTECHGRTVEADGRRSPRGEEKTKDVAQKEKDPNDRGNLCRVTVRRGTLSHVSSRHRNVKTFIGIRHKYGLIVEQTEILRCGLK